MSKIKTPNELLHGTLDTLILKTLAAGPRHDIEDVSGEAVLIDDGSLYPPSTVEVGGV